MSEKRFHIDKDFREYPKLVDTETDCFYPFEDSIINVEIFCERLNELSTNNRQLKKENEQLRKERKYDAIEFSALFKQNYRLKRENEQLKTEVEYWKHRDARKQDLEKQVKHIQNLIYKKKMQRLKDE